MKTVRRLLGVAGVRFRESFRGPLAGFLLFYAAIAAAVCVLTPGEAGPDRQRAVDRMVLDAALLVSALAAAAFGATSLAADRAAGRDGVLGATPLRPAELLAGGLGGHGLGLLLLLFGLLGTGLGLTEILSGGGRDRAPTRVAVFAEGSGGVILKEPGASATLTLRIPPEAFEPGRDGVRATLRLREFSDPGAAEFPLGYDVGIAVGEGPVEARRVVRGLPTSFTIPREAVGEGGRVTIRIQRLGGAYSLGIFRSALVAEGPRRPFLLNLLKALLAWLPALLVLAAAAAALSTFVQAPVAAAGALLLALVGHSLGLLEETAELLRTGDPKSPTLAGFLHGLAAIWPDFDACDMMEAVVRRFDIAGRAVLGRWGPSLGSAAVFLVFGRLVLFARRRR